MMTPKQLVRYQKLAVMGYLTSLDCKNDSRHPPVIPDIDNPHLAVRCVVPDCGYYWEIGLQEQNIMLNRIKTVEKLIELGVYDEM